MPYKKRASKHHAKLIKIFFDDFKTVHKKTQPFRAGFIVGFSAWFYLCLDILHAIDINRNAPYDRFYVSSLKALISP